MRRVFRGCQRVMLQQNPSAFKATDGTNCWMETKPQKTGGATAVFLVGLFAVALVVGAVVWFVEKPAATQAASSLPAPVTGHVVHSNVNSEPAAAEPVTVKRILSDPEGVAGRNVLVSGTLGHRDLKGVGWNLKFDLFDANGSSVRLADVAPGTVTNLHYDVTGWVRVVDGKPVLYVTDLQYVN